MTRHRLIPTETLVSCSVRVPRSQTDFIDQWSLMTGANKAMVVRRMFDYFINAHIQDLMIWKKKNMKRAKQFMQQKATERLARLEATKEKRTKAAIERAKQVLLAHNIKVVPVKR